MKVRADTGTPAQAAADQQLTRFCLRYRGRLDEQPMRVLDRRQPNRRIINQVLSSFTELSNALTRDASDFPSNVECRRPFAAEAEASKDSRPCSSH